MGKRIFLFLLTNIAIVLTLSVVMSLLGVGNYVTAYGLDLESLAIFSLVWGMGGAKTGCTKACLGARQLQWIDVEPDQASARLHALEDRSRMTAPAECAVHRDVASLRAEALQHFRHHDRPVGARRRLSRREDFVDLGGIRLGV